jgi:hypothetical protein
VRHFGVILTGEQLDALLQPHAGPRPKPQ